MGKFVATFDGGVVADPEKFSTTNGEGLRFPVYVNERRKNKTTQEYEDSGNVSKIQVTLWGDQAAEDIRKGDVVEVSASLTEREYEGKNGKGRQLQTTWVDSVVVVYRKDNQPVGVGAGAADDSDLPW